MRLIDFENVVTARAEVGEFCRLARMVTQAKGCPMTLKSIAQASRATERIKDIITKADPGMISAPGGSP